MRRSAPRAAVWLLLLTVTTAPQFIVSAAQAAPKGRARATKSAKQRVALGAFTGPKGAGVRDWSIDALKGSKSIAVISSKATSSVAQGSGASDYASVAGKVGASAVVVGRVNLQKKVGWSLDLWVYNGSDGKLIQKVRVRGGLLPGLKNKIHSDLEKLLQKPLSKVGGGGGAAASAKFADEKKPAPKKKEPKKEPPKKEEPKKAAVNKEGEEVPKIVLEEEPEETAPKAAPAATEETEAEAAPEEEVAAAPGAVGPSALDVRLAMRFYTRNFAYTQTLAEFYPNYYAPLLVHTTALSPMFSAHVNAYPGAIFTDGFLAHIGLLGGYEVGFLSKTTLLDKQLKQEHTNFYVGARYRIAFGDNYVSPMFAVGKHAFIIENDQIPIVDTRPGVSHTSQLVDALPDTEYSYRDLGLDVRFDFGTIALGAHGAYRFVTDTGGLQKKGTADKPYDFWFPNAHGFGVTAGIYGGYALTDVIELQLGADFLRYSFDFNPLPAPNQVPYERVAGGATDTYVSGWLGVGVIFPGIPVLKTVETKTHVEENYVEDANDEDIEELD